MNGRRRTQVIGDALAYLELKTGKATMAQTIAKELGVDVAQVNCSLTNYARSHPNGPVQRISTGLFRWVDEFATKAVPEVTPAPAPTPAQTPAPNDGSFTVLKRVRDVVVLLDSQDESVWVARKIKE